MLHHSLSVILRKMFSCRYTVLGIVVVTTRSSIGRTVIPKYFHTYEAQPTILMVLTCSFPVLTWKIDHESNVCRHNTEYQSALNGIRRVITTPPRFVSTLCPIGPKRWLARTKEYCHWKMATKHFLTRTGRAKVALIEWPMTSVFILISPWLCIWMGPKLWDCLSSPSTFWYVINPL